MLFDIGVGNYSWQYVPIGHLESNSKAVDNFHIFYFLLRYLFKIC